MNLLQNLTDRALLAISEVNESLRIDNIIIGKTLYTMKGYDTVFMDMNFCLVLLENSYGFAYFQEEIGYTLCKYVNKEIPDVLKDDIPPYLKVALTDALYCQINRDAQVKTQLFFKGNLRQKATARAKKLISWVPPKSNALLFGAVTEIIEEAKNNNIHLEVFDLEPQKVGLEFDNTCVEFASSSDLLEKMKKADYLITTAMIFVNETADEIFKLANENNVKIIMYMESGSNFGQQLLELGVYAVLAEYFPYYDFFGDTRYNTFEKLPK